MRYEVRTVLTPQEICTRAESHFGPQGAGLRLSNQHPLGMVFQGGGGYVALTLQADTDETVVELETREWDYPVQQFMAQIYKRRRWWHRWRRRPPPPPPPQPTFPILDND